MRIDINSICHNQSTVVYGPGLDFQISLVSLAWNEKSRKRKFEERKHQEANVSRSF